MIGDILQPTHLIFIFVVALLVLGPKRLPEVGRSLGKGIRDFRGAMAGIEDEARGHFDLTQATDARTEPNQATDDVTAAAPAFDPPQPAGTSAEPKHAADTVAPAVPAFDPPQTPATSAEPKQAAETAAAPAAPAATVTAGVGTASATASGSGLSEPDPGEYAD
jgi:sec-independent protein translocase protein TatA